MIVLDNLLDAIASGPDLKRGRCIGQWDLFDDDDPAAVEQAIELCAGCDVRQRCSDWYFSLPPNKRPVGVCAGQIRDWSDHPTRTPKARQEAT